MSRYPPLPSWGLPVQLNEVLVVADGVPAGRVPAPIRERGEAQLVISVVEAQIRDQDRRVCAIVAVQQTVGIPVRHHDQVRVEVEARPVARLVVRGIVDQLHRSAVFDHRLQAVVPTNLARVVTLRLSPQV
jgi:hypothetical protein